MALAQSSRAKPGHITPTGATSTCIGTATTPLCAAETLLACLARGDESLCRRVGAVPPARRLDNAGNIQIDYVVVRTSVIRPEDITDDTRDLDWYKPGYTLIEMDRRACLADQAACDLDTWDDLQVYLRKVVGADHTLWQVVFWRSESEPDLAPDIPDAFQHPQDEAPATTQ
ncbi:MAG: hypothetical protein JO128_15460 [Alphaproteobacteria bacterium]|nr:hypothetical protein [Alphaproteobacteria bacterium]